MLLRAFDRESDAVFDGRVLCYLLRKTFYTLSDWQVRDAMNRFVRSGRHAAMLPDMAGSLGQSTFVSAPVQWVGTGEAGQLATLFAERGHRAHRLRARRARGLSPGCGSTMIGGMSGDSVALLFTDIEGPRCCWIDSERGSRCCSPSMTGSYARRSSVPEVVR